MTLKYEFGGDDYHDGQEFEYDLELSQLYEYFKGLPDRILKQYCEEGYDSMNEQEQSEILTDLINDNDSTLLMKRREGYNVKWYPNFEQLLEDDEEWCIDTFIIDNNLDVYEDELKEYFEDDAYEAYKEQLDAAEDQRDLERWYYSTRGV